MRSALGFDLFFSAREVGGVNVVGVDDAYYRVEPWQVRRLQREAEKGLPIVLLLHVPLFEQSLYDRMMDQEGVPYLTGCDEAHLRPVSEYRAVQQRPTEDTLRFVEYVNSQPLIKCVLAGHVHLNHEGVLPGGIPQLVTGLNCDGIAREVELY